MTDQILANLCTAAYKANIMGQGSIGVVYAAFGEQAKDTAFMTAAKAKLASCQGIDEKRCFETAKTREFITQAIAKCTA